MASHPSPPVRRAALHVGDRIGEVGRCLTREPAYKSLAAGAIPGRTGFIAKILGPVQTWPKSNITSYRIMPFRAIRIDKSASCGFLLRPYSVLCGTLTHQRQDSAATCRLLSGRQRAPASPGGGCCGAPRAGSKHAPPTPRGPLALAVAMPMMRPRFYQADFPPCPCGGIGRRGRLKICWWQHRAGSSPARGTNLYFRDPPITHSAGTPWGSCQSGRGRY
jgi:hypothetical protein